MFRVLVVEDEDLLRRIITRNLALRGYTVAEAATVAEADDALEASTSSPFEVILLDINLPDRTGWDVLRHLESRLREPGSEPGDVESQQQTAPRVIVMTAVRPAQCRLEQFHPAAVLVKPFPIGALLRLIERVLETVPRSDSMSVPH